MKKNKKTYKTGEKGRNRVVLGWNAARRTYRLTYYPDGRPKYRTCASQNWEEAKKEADLLAADLAAGRLAAGEVLSVGKLFDMYQVAVCDSKGRSKQEHDRRAARVFTLAWGRDFPVDRLSRKEWDGFIRARRTGSLTGFRPVRDRQVEYDLKALKAALRWAVETRRDDGSGYLLDRDPTAGLKMPREKNPRRVLIEQEECDRLFAVADQVDWRFRVAFVLAYFTGCRIGSISNLRWSEVDLSNAEVHWRGETDKSGYERTCELSEEAVQVLRDLQRRRRVIGDGWVFPSPKDPSRPVSRNLMRDYWRKAVRLAGLPPVKRRGWHSLRRRFATVTKGTSDRDTMHLMGLKGTAMLNLYRQTEKEAQRQVVESVGTLRAAG